MSNKYALLYLKTFGVKCIENPIEIFFANKNVDSTYFNKPLVKAIYGTNGEGKTAIAHTLDIYKNTILDINYLPAENYVGNFKELVNHNANKIYIGVYFANIDDGEVKGIFHHILEYELADKELFISHETLHIVNGLSWGYTNNEELIFETINGEVVKLNKRANGQKSEIDKYTRNVVRTSSAALPILTAMIFSGDKIRNDLIDREMSFSYAVMSVCNFSAAIKVYIDNRDKHTESYERAYSLLDKVNTDEKNKSVQRFAIDNEVDQIDVDDYERYEEEIDRICRFLQVFKPDLKEIRIDKSINRDKYICKKILVYNNKDKDIEVSSEYESTGVKKLISLYPYLNSVDNHYIVFIDEFDSNIHDVYLCKIIEYFIGYTDGQFIFTTHNLGPMEILKDSGLKHTIDFINNGIVTSWKRSGNYSVVNLYRNGMIPNSPFNINAVDFVKVFGGKGDD